MGAELVLPVCQGFRIVVELFVEKIGYFGAGVKPHSLPDPVKHVLRGINGFPRCDIILDN